MKTFKEFLNEATLRYMIVFEKGKLSSFAKTVAPHLNDKYSDKEFADTIYEHFSDDDLKDALVHLFDIDMDVGGVGPKCVFLLNKKLDIYITLHY